MRYYFEALFSAEYFPYWEFSQLCILFFVLRVLTLLYKIINNQKEIKKTLQTILETRRYYDA
jgi:hypothetical protein